jgi:hypothetical protein
MRDNRVVIDLCELTNGKKGERYNCRMVGTLYGKTIRLGEFDTKLYGRTTRFDLAKS